MDLWISKSGMSKKVLLGLVFFVSWSCGEALATNGMEMIAVGARSSAMGGATCAVAQDATALIENPAGLAHLGSWELDLGFSVLSPVLHFKNRLNDTSGNRDSHQAFYGMFPLPLIAYAQPVSSVPGLVWSAGLFVPGGMGADYTLSHELWPEGISYHSQLIYAKLVAGFGYKITDRLSAGAGLNVGFGWMDMWQPFATSPDFAEGSTAGSLARVIAPTYGQVFQRMGFDEVTCLYTMRQATSVGVGGNVGLLYEMNKWLSFGLSYTSPVHLKWSGRSTMDMTQQFLAASQKFGMSPDLAYQAFGLSPEDGMAAHPDVEFFMDWPQKVGLGIACRPGERLLLAFDVTWINWAETMDKFVMKFSSLDNPNFIKMVGSDSCVRSVSLDWEDQVVFALGTAYQLGKGITLRAGYNYGQNPVPGETAMPTFPAIVEHHVTLGAGKRWEKFEVNAAFEVALKKKLHTGKSLVADAFNDSWNELSEYVFHLTFTWRGSGGKAL